MIEAMACGTPVIAWPCGSVPEMIDDGVTGLIVDSRGGRLAAWPKWLRTTACACAKSSSGGFRPAMARNYSVAVPVPAPQRSDDARRLA